MLQTSLHIVNIGDNAAKIQADKNNGDLRKSLVYGKLA